MNYVVLLPLYYYEAEICWQLGIHYYNHIVTKGVLSKQYEVH